MPATVKLRVLSKEQAKTEARRINDQGVAEPLIMHSVLCEETLWDELLTKFTARGSNISREFRRWAQEQVKK